jgi:glycine cleavage system H protein
MTNIPNDLEYTRDHKWVRPSGGGQAQIGITDFGQRQFGGIVFLELPDTGSAFLAGEPFGTLESAKGVSEIYIPMAATIAAVNQALDAEPELINNEPYEGGWIIRVELSDPDGLEGLLTPAEYKAYCGE